MSVNRSRPQNINYRTEGYVPSRDLCRSTPAPTMPRDLHSEAGATALCAELDAWWHSRGYLTVKHRIEKLDRTDGHGRMVYVVRSNLINGLPPKESE